MARRRRRGGDDALNPWPGYVDALSTLLMVIIFVLLVFVLAQAFLSVALTGRDRALDRLNRQVAELTDTLSLERGRAGDLQASVAQLNRDLVAAVLARDALTRELSGLRDDQVRMQADRDALKSDRDSLSARLADALLQAQAAAARNEQMQARVAETTGRTDLAGQEAASLAAGLADARRQLAASQTQVAQLQAQMDRQTAEAGARAAAQEKQRLALAAQLADVQAELARTVQADRATIEAKLADLAKMTEQMRALSALRDDLERQTRDAAVRAMTEEQRRQAAVAQLANEQKLSEGARAQVALLTAQIEQLRAQLAQVGRALDIAESSRRDKDAQIVNLGSRLNAALASKVEELQRYRSEFFGRLRDVLANRPGIQVVGDRFVFQSEVLFPVGSADLTPAGQDQLRQLAATLKSISDDIPKDLNWLLRVDGHADRQKVAGGVFASNWELSSQRAINVVKLLVAEGIPANRLAATGFGENQPLDPGDGAQAFARNRRIELRLTDR
jgi:chemotaxis protein MotB